MQPKFVRMASPQRSAELVVDSLLEGIVLSTNERAAAMEIAFRHLPFEEEARRRHDVPALIAANDRRNGEMLSLLQRPSDRDRFQANANALRAHLSGGQEPAG